MSFAGQPRHSVLSTRHSIIPVRNRTPSSTFEASRASITLRGRVWQWPRRDLNPHARRQRLLRPPRLPLPPLGRSSPAPVSWAGFEPAISGVKTRRPQPDRPTRTHRTNSKPFLAPDGLAIVRRAGVEPAQLKAGGLQPLRLANAQPTHYAPPPFIAARFHPHRHGILCHVVARVGVEPTASSGLSRGGLPVAYLADRSTLDGI